MRPVYQGRAPAQRFGFLPVPGEALRVVHFVIQQRQPQMMMRRDRLRLRAGLGGPLQRPFIRAQRLTQTALRNLNIGHAESGGDDEDDVADLPHGAHPAVQRAAGGFQIAVRPVRELQHDDRLGAAVNILFRDELLRQFGVLQRVGHMALHLGIVSARQRDAARQGPELRLELSPVRCAGQGALGVLQVTLAGLRLTGI